MTKIAILKERRDNETRVAASPETVKKFASMGIDVTVETGAGDLAHISDDQFRDAGANIESGVDVLVRDADVVLKVLPPTDEELKAMKPGALLVALLSPYQQREAINKYAEQNVTSFSMEFIPRITRAQSMDVLSSQANLAGYKAVVDAASEYGRSLPMMMTAAGTISPARVMVLGAGVAGLQAIATAKRLGAIVSATDVRPAVKEQVESLGATFVMVDSDETKDAETAGGYAKEMSEDYQRRQAELVAETLKKQDIAICTALIPGRQAPTLITAEMARSMKPGSIIVDLAVEQGGNCELSEPGKTVDVDGVKIIGHLNVPGLLASDASMMYAKNLLNFLTPLIDQESGALSIDWEDEIVVGTCLTRDGKVVHPNLVGQEAA